jgi:predicted dehydrogenase
MTQPIKVAVVGVGNFGRHHARVYRELPEAELVGVYDTNEQRSAAVASDFRCRRFGRFEDLFGEVDAASVAVPTGQHSETGQKLMAAGIDVLIEKPMARTASEAEALIATARQHRRILQIGHLERFNPAVQAAREVVSSPLFFEVHRLSVFSPRSLEVDVVLDLMIHDLDIVLSLVDSRPEEIRAVGLAVLTPRIDIANVRVCFQNGCVANFTASRVSTEQIRKLRWFQPHQYISVDYARQEASITAVDLSGPQPVLSYQRLQIPRQEPLRLQLLDFLTNVRQRSTPTMGGTEGQRVLAVAHEILDEISRHSNRLKTRVGVAPFPPSWPEEAQNRDISCDARQERERSELKP